MLRRNPRYTTSSAAQVSIRWTDHDDGELRAVAALDAQRLPAGPWLVAEVEGEALAVLSISTGSFVSNPFSRTVELRSLLELRAEQLGERERRDRRLGHALGFSAARVAPS